MYAVILFNKVHNSESSVLPFEGLASLQYLDCNIVFWDIILRHMVKLVMVGLLLWRELSGVDSSLYYWWLMAQG